MTLNIVFGFVIPWIVALFWVRKAVDVFLLICPIASVVSLLINQFGFYTTFWCFTPIIPRIETISALPLDLGIYPVSASLMIYWIRRNKIKPFWIVIFVSSIITLLEFMGVLFGKVIYGNGWHVGWTLFSYLLAYGIVYFYYTLLIRNVAIGRN
ncbi:hypothetical protein PV433_10995 [Paenibacillus sp. GYB004]|uniref:CBO0543 family protein n=1 Tax=Paenibacillus sp. GYB004 TaxID=2994393 RepID=UPI002F96CA37